MKERKKILYLVTKSVWGGAQRYVFDLAKNFKNSGHDVVVALGGNGPLAEKLKIEGIRVIHIPSLERDIKIIDELALFFRLTTLCIRERPDIIHLNSSKIGGVGAIAGKFGKIFSRKKNVIVFTAHGWAWGEERPGWQRHLIIVLTRIAGFFQDRIIVISKHDFDSALRYGIPERKIHFIQNGIGEIQFLAPLDAQRAISEKIGTHLKRPAIAVIAELTRNKGISYLMQALRMLKRDGMDFSCVIIGDGEKRNATERLIEKNDLNEMVYCTGFIENAAQFLKAFDILVLPSIKEGLPYVLLEGMQAGLPLVGTRVGGVPDIIENGKNGFLVEPRDPASLAHAIARAISLKDSLLPAGAKPDQRFSLTHMLHETERAYA